MAKYNRFLLNSLGAEIKDLTKQDVGTLVAAMQGGFDRHIRLAMQPTRPSPADAARITNRLNDPAESKRGGPSARRKVITPGPGHGLVSIMWPNGLFYANTAGAFGVVSAGRNWDRIASAVRRWDLKLVDTKEVPIFLFSGDTLC